MFHRLLSIFEASFIALILIFTLACGFGLSRSHGNGGNTVAVTLDTTSATVAPGATQQFNATVTGSSNTAVQWEVNQVAGGNAQVGTISTGGLYTAPTVTSSMTVTVTAVAAADSSKSASATVTVKPSQTGGVSVTISPTTATLTSGVTQQFTATVTGATDTSVQWQVNQVAGGNSTAGTISSTGLYTAPTVTAATTVTVSAISNADNTQSASASVTVNPASGPVDLSAIQHIIFLADENRSFDSYFGKLDEYRAAQGLPTDVDGLPDDCSSTNSDWTVPCSAMNKSPDAQGYPTTPVYAFHLKTMCIENTSADWIVSHWDFNAEDPTSDTPLMDGFVISAASSAISTGTSDTQGIRAMGFYTAKDLAYPYWLATNFATSDRWFSPEAARTQPNRYYMVGATSGGQAYPSGVTIKQKTIFDELTAAGISWKIYSEDGNTSATAFSGFQANGNIVPYSQFITDAQNGTLPQVAYLEKPDADSHPGLNSNIQSGVQQMQTLVNAVMYGPSWKDSVMIVTFDEGGGLYDHVAPPTNVPNPDGIKPLDICTSSSDPRCTLAQVSHQSPPYDPDGDFTRTGFRVPLMVISPWTKPHYVSHTTTDYTSWLKLVEKRFNLPALNARDAWASDMSEYFDFQNVPWATPPQNPPTVTVDNSLCYDSLP